MRLPARRAFQADPLTVRDNSPVGGEQRGRTSLGLTRAPRLAGGPLHRQGLLSSFLPYDQPSGRSSVFFIFLFSEPLVIQQVPY